MLNPNSVMKNYGVFLGRSNPMYLQKMHKMIGFLFYVRINGKHKSGPAELAFLDFVTNSFCFVLFRQKRLHDFQPTGYKFWNTGEKYSHSRKSFSSKTIPADHDLSLPMFSEKTFLELNLSMFSE